QWVAWARRNGATFKDVASLALLSVARPGGQWVGTPRVAKKPKDGHLLVGDLDNDIDFIHYDKAGNGQVADGYLGAQTTGRRRLIAYRRDYPYDPSASYPWEM